MNQTQTHPPGLYPDLDVFPVLGWVTNPDFSDIQFD